MFIFCSDYGNCETRPSDKKSGSSDEPTRRRVSVAIKNKPGKSKLNGLIQSLEEANPRRPATKSPPGPPPSHMRTDNMPSLTDDMPSFWPPRTPSPTLKPMYQPKTTPLISPSELGGLSCTMGKGAASGSCLAKERNVLPPGGVPPAPSGSSQHCDSSPTHSGSRWVGYFISSAPLD